MTGNPTDALHAWLVSAAEHERAAARRCAAALANAELAAAALLADHAERLELDAPAREGFTRIAAGARVRALELRAATRRAVLDAAALELDAARAGYAAAYARRALLERYRERMLAARRRARARRDERLRELAARGTEPPRYEGAPG